MSKELSPMAMFSKTLSFSRRRKSSSRLRVHSIDNLDFVEDLQFVEVGDLFPQRDNSSGKYSHTTGERMGHSSGLAARADADSPSAFDDGGDDDDQGSSWKIEREREIFLRAALQLLEQEHRNELAGDSLLAHNGITTTSSASSAGAVAANGSGGGATSSTSDSILGSSSSSSSAGAAVTATTITTASGAITTRLQRTSLRVQKVAGSSSEISSDVIRFGILRKASRTGTAFSSLKPQWKGKYVELRYGKFMYEDEVVSHINWSNSDSSNHNRKVIALAIDSCQCRPFRIRSSQGYGSCVFELTHFGGPRRLWLANSERERDVWVAAIKNAMIGGLDDQLGLSHELRLNVFLRPLDSPSSTHHGFSQDPLDQNQNQSSTGSKAVDGHQSNYADDVNADKKPQSWDGPAAAFANEIGKFVSVQSAVRLADRPDSFVDIISKLCDKHITITIPVYYVKCLASDANFALSTQDTFNRQTLQSIETSQIWKDLQRDAVVINGELIRGKSGTEAMVGALMRHIMDKVEIIRSTDELQPESGHHHHHSNSNSSSNQHHQHQQQRQKLISRFDITEAQALACARDLLMLCNRTQSGGDTYFCVDALLCNKSNDLCIITPLAAEADPISISVDIVKDCSLDKSASKPSGSFSSTFRIQRSRSVAAIEELDADALLADVHSDDGKGGDENDDTFETWEDGGDGGGGTGIVGSKQVAKSNGAAISTLLEGGCETPTSSRQRRKTTDDPGSSLDWLHKPGQQQQQQQQQNQHQRHHHNHQQQSQQQPPLPPTSARLPGNDQSYSPFMRPSSTSDSALSSYVGAKGSSLIEDFGSSDADEVRSRANSSAPRSVATPTVDQTEEGRPQPTVNARMTATATGIAESAEDNVAEARDNGDQVISSSADMNSNLTGGDGGGSVWDESSVVSDITADTLWRLRPAERPPISHDTAQNAAAIAAAAAAASTGYAADGADNESVGDERPGPPDSASSVDEESMDIGVPGSPRQRFKISTTGASFFKSITKTFTPNMTPITVRKDAADSGEPASAKASTMIPQSPFTFFRSRGISGSTSSELGVSDRGFSAAATATTAEGSTTSRLTESIFSPQKLPLASSTSLIAAAVASKAAAAANAASAAVSSNGASKRGSISSSVSSGNTGHIVNGSSNSSSGGSYCIRIEVKVNSRYRVCDSNPQDDFDSTWGEVLGQFRQTFFIRSSCKGRPVVSDRIVSVAINKANQR